MAKLFVQVSNCFVLRPAPGGRGSTAEKTLLRRTGERCPVGGEQYSVPEGSVVTYDAECVMYIRGKCNGRPLAPHPPNSGVVQVWVSDGVEEQKKKKTTLFPPSLSPSLGVNAALLDAVHDVT